MISFVEVPPGFLSLEKKSPRWNVIYISIKAQKDNIEVWNKQRDHKERFVIIISILIQFNFQTNIDFDLEISSNLGFHPYSANYMLTNVGYPCYGAECRK